MTPIKYAEQLNATNWTLCPFLHVFEEYFGPDFNRPVEQRLPSDRKFRLFAIATIRIVWEHVTDPRSRAAIEAAERYADDPNPMILDAVRDAANAAFNEAEELRDETVPSTLVASATAAAAALVSEPIMNQRNIRAFPPAWNDCGYRLAEAIPHDRNGIDLVELHHCLFHDIIPNPFRPVALDPVWLTSDVVTLARGIYEERAFDRMPILADALQDAGCTSDEILTHSRDARNVHTRGCWVLDLILGKT
jgi:hypothetical protein